jgi:hypothetical protein
MLQHVKFATLPIGAEFTTFDRVGTFTKTHDSVAVRDVKDMHSTVGFFDYELVTVDASVLEPVMPSQADYVDHMGYPDYEAFDYAMDQYRDVHDHWYEMYGRKQDEMVLAWTAREKKLYAGRWY